MTVLICFQAWGDAAFMNKKSMLLGFILTWLLGFLGVHHFYYNHKVRGILYLVFCWTFIPLVLSVIDMFFVPRWTRVVNGPPPKLPPIGSKRPSKTALVETIAKPVSVKRDMAKHEIVRQEVVKPKTVEEPAGIKSKAPFYSECDLILPKYAHLKTPPTILESVQNVIGVKKAKGVEIWTSNMEFGRDSLKYATKRGKKCEHVPLMTYYTQFRDLNGPQKNWYFYWREQFLNHTYLDTDLSYIYLFIYELLNYTFHQNVAFNLSVLERLLNHYVEQYPNLRFNLHNWINDMLEELGETTYESSADYTYGQEYLQLQSGNLRQISMGFWKRHFKNVRETGFFHSNRAKVYKVFRQAIDLTQEHYRQSGTDLFHAWVEEKETTRQRRLFDGAVMLRTITKMGEYTTRHYEPSERMIPEVTNLFRLSENVTRTLLGHKDLIKVNESVLPEGLKERLIENPPFIIKCESNTRFKKVLSKDLDLNISSIPLRPKENEAVSVEIELDISRIQALHDESRQFVAFFNEHYAPEEEVATDKIADLTEEVIESFVESVNISLTGTAGEPDALISMLSVLEVQFLLRMTEGRFRVEEAIRFLKECGTMPGVFMDKLNEKAMEVTGDVLIEMDGDEYVLVDDDADILHQIQP